MPALTLAATGRTFGDLADSSRQKAEEVGFENGRPVQDLVRAAGDLLGFDGNEDTLYNVSVSLEDGSLTLSLAPSAVPAEVIA